MSDLRLGSPINYEPLQVQRWSMEFPADISIEPFMLAKASSPKQKHSNVKMGFINTVTHVKGKSEWEAMSITIRNFIAPSSLQALMEWSNLHHESISGRDGYAIGYKKDVKLNMLDPTGVIISQWLCKNCMLSDTIDFGGELDYESDGGILQSTFSIQPEYCVLLF